MKKQLAEKDGPEQRRRREQKLRRGRRRSRPATGSSHWSRPTNRRPERRHPWHSNSTSIAPPSPSSLLLPQQKPLATAPPNTIEREREREDWVFWLTVDVVRDGTEWWSLPMGMHQRGFYSATAVSRWSFFPGQLDCSIIGTIWPFHPSPANVFDFKIIRHSLITTITSLSWLWPSVEFDYRTKIPLYRRRWLHLLAQKQKNYDKG